MPFLFPGDLPNPGIEPGSLALQADSLPSEPQGKQILEWPLKVKREVYPISNTEAKMKSYKKLSYKHKKHKKSRRQRQEQNKGNKEETVTNIYHANTNQKKKKKQK